MLRPRPVESLVHWLARRPRPAASPTPPWHFDPADFAPALQTQLLVLQPTPFCNIDCDYCYLPDRTSTARMSLDTVRQAAERLRADGLLGERLTIVWHAGEPLTLPIDYLDAAMAAAESALGAGCAVAHSIQTNATLIDADWCELFRRRRVRIGVSVDGPQALHDAHRRTRRGAGTHERVRRGMARLREHGIEFHAIAVVTAATLAHADAFVDFFEAEGVHDLGCNFDEAEGAHRVSSLGGHEAAHAAFVARLLERTGAPGAALRIRELELARRLIAEPLPAFGWQGRRWPFNAQTVPFALVNVSHRGDFGSFSPELLGQRSDEFGDFSFGNVASEGYFEGARGERFGRLWRAIVRGLDACDAGCSHFGFCGGGAPANKYYENGDLGSAETLYCRSVLKRPFDAVLARLEHERHAATGSH